MLLAAVSLDNGDTAASETSHFLAPESAPRLQAASELCWLTCAASKLNAEELARSGGVPILGEILTRCASVVPTDVHPHDPAAVLLVHVLRAFAGMAAFPTGREIIAGDRTVIFISDVLRVLTLTRASAAVDAALHCVIQMCQNNDLQSELLYQGALGYLLPLLLHYDPSVAGPHQTKAISSDRDVFKDDEILAKETQRLSEGKASELEAPEPVATDDGLGASFITVGVTEGNMQMARNRHAALAVRALAALAGYTGVDPATETMPDAQKALSALLTPTLAPRLSVRDPYPLLHDLNRTVTSPHVIWNSDMREELLRKSESLKERRGPSGIMEAADFGYTCLKEELVVSDVYVRIYNEQPTFAINNPAEFCKSIVRQIYSFVVQIEQYDGDKAAHSTEDSATMSLLHQQHLLQCLQALNDLLDSHPKLMGLLSTRPALDPLVSCLKPVVELGHSGPLWPEYELSPGPVETMDEREASDATANARYLPAHRYETRFRKNVMYLKYSIEASSRALSILLKLTAHAGCIHALAAPYTVLCFLWIIYRPTSAEDRMHALQILHDLSSSSNIAPNSPDGSRGNVGSSASSVASDAVAQAVTDHAGWVYLLAVTLPSEISADEEMRRAHDASSVVAVAILSRAIKHPLHGPKLALWLRCLLSPGIVAAFQDSTPEQIMASLSQSIESPECLWTASMRSHAAAEISHLASSARTQQSDGRYEWSPGEKYRLQHSGLEDKLYIGGVYIDMYLKDPAYRLRNPQQFLQSVLEEYIKSASSGAVTSGRGKSAGDPAAATSHAVLLSTTAIAAIQHNPPLADYGVALGYVPKLLHLLRDRAPTILKDLPVADLDAISARLDPPGDIAGSTLRLLHALSTSYTFGEALGHSPTPPVPLLTGSMLWRGAVSVLAAEIVKRGLHPTNRARDILVLDCLEWNLLKLLLHRLDWRIESKREPYQADLASTNGQEPETQYSFEDANDEGIQRVLYVDIIRLLELEGAHMEKVRKILDDSPVWAAYRGQSHELFLPVGGSSAALQGSGLVGLLQGSDSTRFMLSASDSHSKNVSMLETEDSSNRIAESSQAAPHGTTDTLVQPQATASQLEEAEDPTGEMLPREDPSGSSSDRGPEHTERGIPERENAEEERCLESKRAQQGVAEESDERRFAGRSMLHQRETMEEKDQRRGAVSEGSFVHVPSPQRALDTKPMPSKSPFKAVNPDMEQKRRGSGSESKVVEAPEERDSGSGASPLERNREGVASVSEPSTKQSRSGEVGDFIDPLSALQMQEQGE